MMSIVALCLVAAAAPQPDQEPMTALQVFEKTQKLYASLEGFTAEIHEETIVRAQSEKAVARLYFKPPALLRVEYYDEKDPSNVTQLLVIDGKQTWSYTPFFNQATRKKIPESRAKEWLPGVGTFFETLPELYDLSLIHDEITEKKNIHRLQIKRKPMKNEPQLQPQTEREPKESEPQAQEQEQIEREPKESGPQPQAPSELFDIWIDGKTWLPVQISYSNSAGIVTVIQLKKVDIKAKPKESLFQFIPPPGVEIFTLRDEILPEAEDSADE